MSHTWASLILSHCWGCALHRLVRWGVWKLQGHACMHAHTLTHTHTRTHHHHQGAPTGAHVSIFTSREVLKHKAMLRARPLSHKKTHSLWIHTKYIYAEHTRTPTQEYRQGLTHGTKCPLPISFHLFWTTFTPRKAEKQTHKYAHKKEVPLA